MARQTKFASYTEQEEGGAGQQDKIRLDKWLWAARFFKTRHLAADAVSGGKVHVNGQRAKPSKEIAVGAQLSIHKDQLAWDVTVVALNAQRRPAKEAVLLYEETAQSIAKRQQLAELKRENRELGLQSDTRPNKKERRQIQHFKRNED